MTSFKQNELVWLSVLQGFAIFLVVLGHVIDLRDGSYVLKLVMGVR